MDKITWFNVMEKVNNDVYAIVQEGYIQELSLNLKTKESRHSWAKADHYRVNLKVVKSTKPYVISKRFSETLFRHRDIFRERLERWARNFTNYMNKVLTLKDFEWIILSKKAKSGYYSFKTEFYEICLDQSDIHGWLVCLANNHEEVLEEVIVKTKREALAEANRFYKSFAA